MGWREHGAWCVSYRIAVSGRLTNGRARPLQRLDKFGIPAEMVVGQDYGCLSSRVEAAVAVEIFKRMWAT